MVHVPLEQETVCAAEDTPMTNTDIKVAATANTPPELMDNRLHIMVSSSV